MFSSRATVRDLQDRTDPAPQGTTAGTGNETPDATRRADERVAVKLPLDVERLDDLIALRGTRDSVPTP